MEKVVGANYIQIKNDCAKGSEISSCAHSSLSRDSEKNECKGCGKISRFKKKVVSLEQNIEKQDPLEIVTSNKTRKKNSGSKLIVLKKNVTDTASHSVQKKTKIFKKNVPDRLEKYVSYSIRSETKLFLSDCNCNIETKSLSHKCPYNDDSKSLEGHSKMKLFDGISETKLALLGNECLNNKEAVSLSNSFESDSIRSNIFENFFDDCLGSTSKEKDASSQENLHLKGNKPMRVSTDVAEKNDSLLDALGKNSKKVIENKKTPTKKKRETCPPATPVKLKDHSNYYRSHKNMRHVCAYCQKIFKSNGKLNSHVFSHTGERPFDCNHCGKAFSSKFKLVRHLLIHSEIRKFVCQICDRTFLRNDHLKNHYKVHDPQKKMYKCPKENCDKEYSSIMSHKKHMAYHNVEDGDLKCLICNVKCETKEEVLFHLKSHSGSRLFKSQSDKKFKCEFCDRLFLTRKDVTRHLVVHTGERDFLCQFCPQRFGRKDHLVRHIKKSHGNEDLAVKNEGEVKASSEESRNTNEKRIKKYHAKNSDSTENFKECKSSSLSTEATAVTDLESMQAQVPPQDTNQNKTHIVITVQEKLEKCKAQNRRQNTSDDGTRRKPFQKSEASVSKRKHSPSTKNKNPTTQILFQNIPNILIIPNNSIILVRNQGSEKSSAGSEVNEVSADVEPEPEPQPQPLVPAPSTDDFLGRSSFLQTPAAASDGFNANFNYESNSFLPSPQYLGGFPDGFSFCNFQTDLLPYASQFAESSQAGFEMLNHGDLLPRSELGSNTDTLANGNLLTETSRQIKLLESGMSTTPGPEEKAGRDKSACEDLGKVFFEDGVLNESILNDFKDEAPGILPADNDVGILGNMLNQSNDNCGFELLRNLLTSENPVQSPLPGFSQIFHNSNTNSS